MKNLAIESKLPQQKTTIFTVMSELATKHQAINLGQGFPDFHCDPNLLNATAQAMQKGFNQYAPMIGVLELRQAISQKIHAQYGYRYDVNKEITITAGATQAIYTAIQCCVQNNDEVILIEPAFDSYLPAIQLAGGKPIPIPMKIKRDANGQVAGYAFPWDEIAKATTPKTRLLILNTPHNPTGVIWQEEDIQRLRELVNPSNILLLSDEVYEHMVCDGQPHLSIARYPDLAKRSFLISSFGKTFHVTGWKVAFMAAPENLTTEFRKVHQFNVFTVNTPMQFGIASFMSDPKHYINLSDFYQSKRDYFRTGLVNTGLKLLPCQGSYFQCVDYSGLQIKEAQYSDAEFCCWLTTELGVAAIPNSAFYTNQTDLSVIRFCFAKKEETLQAALNRLQVL